MESYAQNFEDIILWRALQDVPSGFYIDLGAHHPVLDSVSKWFYEQGWRGIHVEPLKFYADCLRQDRPDEDVIQAAVSEEPGDHIIYAFPDTGLSTMSAEIANTHKSRLDRDWQQETVSSLTLDEVFKRAGARDVHWLKVDVEGHERSALASWGNSLMRPWIVVVESTYPNTQVETHEEWEFLLTPRGYSFVYADGLNRYYLHEAHEDLRNRFRYPPNYFDYFSLGDHWATHELRAANERDLQEAVNLRDQAREEKEHALAALRADQDQSAEREHRLVVALSKVSQDLVDLSMEHVAGLKADLVTEVSRSYEALESRIAQSDSRAAKTRDAAQIKLVAQIQSIGDLARRIQTRVDEHGAERREADELLRQAVLRLEDDAHRLQMRMDHLLDDFKRFGTNRWMTLKALLQPRKMRLLASENFSSADLKPKGSGSRAISLNPPSALPETNFKHHGQGLNRLTEEEDVALGDTLGDLYALPPIGFIKASFRILLGREADAAGLSHYMRRMALGDSRPDIHRSIVGSKEYHSRALHDDLMILSKEDFVEAAYRRILGRAPDAEGAAHYQEHLRVGKARRLILRDLSYSREARSHPLSRLRAQIEASVGRRFGILRGRRAARQMASLEFALSSAINRVEVDLHQQMSSLRADMKQLAPSSPTGWFGVPAHDPSNDIVRERPRWVPREVRAARQTNTGMEANETTVVHPDYLVLANRMKSEAPFGELNCARAGQGQIDDFLEDAFDAEEHGYGPVRWIGRDALAYLRVTGFRFNMEAAGFFEDRSVLVFFNEVVIGTLEFGREQTVAELPVEDWVGQDVIINLRCAGVFNPAAAGVGPDQRDLSLLIRSIYFG